MYNNPPIKIGGAIAAGAGLAHTGLASSQLMWWGIALVVVGSAFIAFARLFPNRIALDAVKNPKKPGRYKLGITKNGKPIRFPRKKK